jgi:hypothetical protein
MKGGISETIGELRRVVHASSDSDLARKLGVDKSAISGWRARGSVPKRFLKMLDTPSSSLSSAPMQIGGEVQDAGHRVALVRFVLLRSDLARSGDVDQAMRLFSELRLWWIVMHRAVHDLLTRVETLSVDIATAQALLMQEDLRDPEETARRVEAQLAEDVADNPGLWAGK